MYDTSDCKLQMRDATACIDCLRRSWLLTALSGHLDNRRHDLQRMSRLLALSDSELLEALGANKREDLLKQYDEFDPEWTNLGSCTAAVCRHDPQYPYVLTQTQTLDIPAVLYLAGEMESMWGIFKEPAVAIVGTRKATDYGMELARSLARDLTAAGIVVVSGMAEGISAAAHLGALDANGPTLTVMPGGVDICYPATKRILYQRIQAAGCALSELPCGFRGRRWCYTARNRIIAKLVRVVIVVEAEKRPGDLMLANLAKASNKTLAAIPGRVTSAMSQGSHGLLKQGAHLVEGAQDVLDLMYGVGAKHVPVTGPDLEPELQAVLEHVGAGNDTLTKLAAKGVKSQDALMALTELELLGKVARGDGGRYVPCMSLAGG
jgi:DNA processing protein